MKKNQLKTAAAQGAEPVMVFENPEFGKIRMIEDQNGEPLFCGKDVCEALGYSRADLAVRRHVNSSDAAKRCIARIIKNRYGVCEGKTQRAMMLFVNESGLYALVLGSKLDSAQRFKQWVTAVVLPQIRKTGVYVPMALIAQQKKLLGQQVARIEQLNRQVEELLPKAIYSDNVLNSVSCFTTTQIAKELGTTAQELNRALCAAHVQYYQSGQYLLYADYAHMRLAKSRTKTEYVMCRVTEDGFKAGHILTRTYLVWTERGRKFIHQFAKRFGELSKGMVKC